MVVNGVSEQLIAAVGRVAFEIREVLEARGHHVTAALDHDEAFRRRGTSKSSLVRDLVVDGFARGASSVGFDLDTPKGGSQQFRVSMDGRIGLFRLRRAERYGHTFRIPTNSSSTWGQIDEDTLMAEDPYVFGFTVDDDMLGELFIAHVDDIVYGSPGHLVLGEAHIFAPGTGSPGSGFAPSVDETLPGFENEDEDSLVGEESA